MTTAASLLLDTALRGELHHAIIVHGPALEPLREIAVRVAKALNCLNGTASDDCAACQRIERRIHPDVHFIEVSGERKLISIEQIRDLLNEASLRPFEGRNKVFIIDPADALSSGGSNALLKTLEEPTRNTTFILITRSPDLLLPTIRSRSQAIYVGTDAKRSIGAPLQATRIEQVAMFASDEQRNAMASQILDALHRFATRGDSAALLSLAAAVSASDDAKDAIALAAGIFCDAAALDDSQAVDAKKLAAIRERIPRERLLAAADVLMAGIRALGVNADARLVVEQAMAALVGSDAGH
jgi:DNA polymerase III delta prime subunit